MTKFRKQFLRLPNHSEKEPMRPLYIYYRSLKTMITQVDAPSKPDEGVQNAAKHQTLLTPMPENDDVTGEDKSHQSKHKLQYISALEARLETLQTEKSNIRSKLQAFQESFLVENNRKIRFHKDILPIEREYRMYKSLKEELAKVESDLRDIRVSDI